MDCRSAKRLKISIFFYFLFVQTSKAMLFSCSASHHLFWFLIKMFHSLEAMTWMPTRTRVMSDLIVYVYSTRIFHLKQAQTKNIYCILRWPNGFASSLTNAAMFPGNGCRIPFTRMPLAHSAPLRSFIPSILDGVSTWHDEWVVIQPGRGQIPSIASKQ